MIVNFAEKQFEVKHQEIQDNWETISLDLDDEVVKLLSQLEPELKAEGLTINDLMLSYITFFIEETDYIERELKRIKTKGE